MALLKRFLSQPSVIRTPTIQQLSPHSFSTTKQLRSGPPKHVLKISDLTNTEVTNILKAALALKKLPLSFYNKTLENKTLLMLFEKPSLRTHISFQVGMTQLGGNGLYYSVETSPLGQKETFSDTGAVLSRYCDGIMARVKKRQDIWELSKYATIPVINGLDDLAHPTQILADLLTIKEYKTTFDELKFVYFGDVHNNVTYDLMRGCNLMGFKQCIVCGPINQKGNEYNIEDGILDECKNININNKCELIVTDDVKMAAENADVIYTDSWMSYGVSKELQDERMNIFGPYRVTTDIMNMAKNDCIFMNCLPALRGHEQTAQVIDGEQSVVFNQAENRLHAQKALLLYLINGNFDNNNGYSYTIDNYKF
eukprot:727692_1